MADKSIFLIVLSLLCWDLVSAYYCEFSECDPELEYCCGFNVCCTSFRVWDLWYFWLGIIFFLFLVSTCACCWRHRPNRHILVVQRNEHYAPLLNEPQLGPEVQVTQNVHFGTYQGVANNMPKPPAYDAANQYGPSGLAPPPYAANQNHGSKS